MTWQPDTSLQEMADRLGTAHLLRDETRMEHLDGVPWHDAPLPRRWHRCRPQTRGWVKWFTRVERCACGAIRLDGRFWLNRNERRKEGEAP